MWSAVHVQKQYQPTCSNCPGTYIPNQERQAYLARAAAKNFVDQQVRAVDIGKANLDVGVAYKVYLQGRRPDTLQEVRRCQTRVSFT